MWLRRRVAAYSLLIRMTKPTSSRHLIEPAVKYKVVREASSYFPSQHQSNFHSQACLFLSPLTFLLDLLLITFALTKLLVQLKQILRKINQSLFIKMYFNTLIAAQILAFAGVAFGAPVADGQKCE